MFSIGELSKRTQVKVPTIRYYEQVGLLTPPKRTEGNQRRYDTVAVERLRFVRHARDLGFPIDAISSLIELQDHPDRHCRAATEIAEARLGDVREKIGRLRALERELRRISEGCDGSGISKDCSVLASLADHGLSRQDH